MLHLQSFACVSYIDNFNGFSTPNVAEKSFQALYALFQHLRLTISDKRLVGPSMHVVGLGVQLDSVQGTISIPEDKF